MLSSVDSLRETPPMIVTEDQFRRRVSYLRISLTDRCNLRCRYCMPNTGLKFFPRESFLSFEDLKRLLRIFKSLGVMKVRLTGGEPLLRPDLEEIIREISALDISDVSVTTNGMLLETRIQSLADAGLKRINISLDTFQRERFYKITGSDALDRVFRGIWSAIDSNLNPIKINMVVMREWNLDEIEEFVWFAKRAPVEVRFLELMPTVNNFEGTAGVSKDSFVSIEEIHQHVLKVAELGPEDLSKGVAKVYPILDGIGKIGFISPVSDHFCGSCNRIRLTARGTLKTCLHGEERLDLKSALQKGASDQEIREMIRDEIFQKPEEHFIRPSHYESRFLQMSQVGG